MNEIYISPSEFGGTRQEKYAALYEKFLYEMIEFEYLPAVGAETPGALILAYDRDISDPTPPADEQGVRQYTAMEGARDGNVWTKHTIRCKLTQPDSGYYTNPVTGGDDRLAYQGQFYTAVTVPTGLAAGKTLGRIRMRYKCHFFTPQLEGTPSSADMTFRPGANPNVPIGPGNNFDFLSQFQRVGAVIQGVQKYKPILDSLGKCFVDLPQGVYRYTPLLSILGVNNSVNTNTGGINQFDPPVLQPNEPMPATAPQPWVEELSSGATSYAAADEPFGPVSADYLLGIPRGGAKLYHTMDVETSLVNLAPEVKTVNYQALFNRIGGYNLGGTSLFTARWHGVEEVRRPKDFLARARGRSRCSGCVTMEKTLPAAVASVDMDIEELEQKLRNLRLKRTNSQRAEGQIPATAFQSLSK